MRRLWIAALFAVVAGSAAAGDLPVRRGGPTYAEPIVPVRLFDWTGFYAGAHVGYGWSDGADTRANGVIGGLQGGYNYQFGGGFVLGAEADIALSGISGNNGGLRFSSDYVGTLRARAGFAVDRMLFYGTAGFGYGRADVTLGGLSDKRMHTGWTAGVGVEGALTRNWTARVEYLHVNTGVETYVSVLGPVRTDFDVNMLRMGMNYRF